MNAKIYMITIFFVTFLTLPTLLLVAEKDDFDVSVIYNLSEEEEKHNSFNFKASFKQFKQSFTFSFKSLSVNKINTENCIQYNAFLKEIFSPPPEIMMIYNLISSR